MLDTQPPFSRSVVEAAKLLAAYLQSGAIERERASRPLSRAKHPAWEYFERVDRYDAICLLCSSTVRSACSTNLSRHIQKHHESTALEMRKAWLAGRRGGVSPPAAPSAIAATSAATDSEMNCDGGDPACPLLVNPYSSAMMNNQIGQPLLTSTLALSDLASSWCQLPYPDLRTIDATPSYETDMSLGYPDLAVHKFEQMKYEYPEIRAEKQYEEPPRLYHKEEIKTEDEGMKEDEKTGDATPVKRGRPTENPCWHYFIRLDDQNVRCRLCSKVVKSACATNMTKHLERHHQNDYQQLIVQIRQYRSAKGHLLPSDGSQCILPTHYVKQETYPDIYAPHGTENDLGGFSNAYDRTDASLWQRQQWPQWHGQLEGGSVVDTRTNGVILHGSTQNWPTTSNGGGPMVAEKPYMKRNRKTEHPVWEYFKRTPDGNAQCAICAGVVKSPCSSNFMRHLMRHHSAEYNNVYVKWVQKRGPAK